MCNIHVKGIPEGGKREGETDDLFKMMTENFLKFMSDIKPQIQKTQHQVEKKC